MAADGGTELVQLLDVQPDGRAVVAAGDLRADALDPYRHAAVAPPDVAGGEPEDVTGPGYRGRRRVDQSLQPRIAVAAPHRRLSFPPIPPLPSPAPPAATS